MSTDQLNFENHLERDPRLDRWSFQGLGPLSQTTEDWVKSILSSELRCELPTYLQDMFDRAKACCVYGCYHYPLFTLGIEELYRFLESAMLEAAKEAGASNAVRKKSFASLIDWAEQSGYLNDTEKDRWHAGRDLRNMASHKRNTTLVGPNDAIGSLQVSAELVEELFKRVRSVS